MEKMSKHNKDGITRRGKWSVPEMLRHCYNEMGLKCKKRKKKRKDN